MPVRRIVRNTREEWREAIIHFLISRDGFICQVCYLSLEDTKFEVDHIIPVYLGGKNILDNMRLLHMTCHRKLRTSWDHHPRKGENHPSARLLDTDIDEIRQILLEQRKEDSHLAKYLAKIFGVTSRHIYNIATGRRRS